MYGFDSSATPHVAVSQLSDLKFVVFGVYVFFFCV